MSHPSFVITDTARKIEGTLTEKGSPITGITVVTLRWRKREGGTVKSAQGVVEDADTGMVSYTFLANDFPDGAGIYLGEWVATVGGNQITVPSHATFEFRVRQQIQSTP